MRTRIAASVITLLLALPSGAAAHEFALVPQPWQVYHTGQEVPFGLVATHAFLKSEELEDPASVSATYEGKDITLQADSVFLQHEGKVKLGKSGVALLRAHRKGEIWSNTPKGWLKGGRDTHKNAITSNKYEKFAKTLLPVDGKTEGFDKVAGDRLEIVPVDNPLAARPGDTVRFKVLLDGKPFAPESVTATYDGFSDAANTWAYLTEPGGDGLASIRLSTSGLWMVRVEHTDRTKTAEYDAHVMRATLVFPVR